MSTGDVRIGIVGTGFGARVVAPVFGATPGCAVTEVVSARDDAAVRALCRRSDLDLVSVHSPPFLHLDHVCRALDAGHAVLCDKPFGTSEHQVAEMESARAAAGSGGTLGLVNFEFRYHTVRVRMRELLRSEAVGEVEHAQWTSLSAGSRVPLGPYGWLFDRHRGGGWIGAWGSHAIDALRWMVGELVVVTSTPRTIIGTRPDHVGKPRRCDAADAFSAVLTFESGATVAIDSGFASVRPTRPRLVICGSDGVIECEADTTITVRRADGTTDEITHGAEGGGDRHLEPMVRWAKAVRDSVHAGGPAPAAATFADGLACARVLDSLRRPAPNASG